MTIYQLFLQFVSFVGMALVLMPTLGGFLIFRGLKALGIPDPPDLVGEKGSQGGWVPPAKMTLKLCLKAVFAGAFTTFLLMILISLVLSSNKGLGDVGLRLALFVIIQTTIVVVLLRRFQVTAIVVVFVVTAVTNTASFAFAFWVHNLLSGGGGHIV